MGHVEVYDPAMILEEWTNRVANLPAEIAFMQEEIENKDHLMQECMHVIAKSDFAIQKWIRQNGSHVENPKEEGLRRLMEDNFDRARVIQEEKIALATKTKTIMDKHTRWIDGHIKGLVDRGELQVEPDFPSMLNGNNDNIVASAILAPISNSSAMVNTRHPNQYPQRQIPAVQATASMSSAPVTPTNALQPGRSAREASMGAASNKRQKLTIPLQTSNLGRQASNAPGTPRGVTPISGVRAGSAGPRSSQATTKKVMSNGLKQPNGPTRKHKKSGLNRVKGVRNRNSPSSTNGSELSDADSASMDDDDAPANRDGDEDMLDEEGGDDRVYCICQKVSFGDMVACDNPNCKFEWFHWNCVGLKSEPLGTWVCPPCYKSGFRKA